MGRGRAGRGASARAVGGERRWGPIIIAAIVVALIAAFVVVVVLDSRQQAAQEPPEGVETIEIASRDHVEEDVDYERTPPAGGEHNPVWQNCGVYEEPVRSENALHSLEHGAVWLTYRPGLPEEQVEQIQDLAEGESYVLVSPMENLPSPVVASTWGKQLQLDGAGAPHLEQFVSAFQQGPQTPEPGAACTGGVGEPQV